MATQVIVILCLALTSAGTIAAFLGRLTVYYLASAAGWTAWLAYAIGQRDTFLTVLSSATLALIVAVYWWTRGRGNRKPAAPAIGAKSKSRRDKLLARLPARQSG